MFDSSNTLMATVSPSLTRAEKKHWWLTNRKMVERYLREAKMLIATKHQSEMAEALGLLEAALAVAPRMEVALELKARCLLYLRRFKEVANMLQDYIPSLKMAISDDSSSTGSSDNSSSQLSRERVKLLNDSVSGNEPAFKCFSVSDLKKKVMAGLRKNDEKGQWRYSILGQACCHLGLMEDALVLLQTGKRLATAAFRRESISLSDDYFSFNKFPMYGENLTNQPQTPPKTESDNTAHLLCHIKLLLRRKTAAIAALHAGLFSESVRHFSKILDGRRGAPQGFLAECYVHRATAYRSAGRVAEAIADCNRALALDTSSIEALTVRATLFETIRCLPDSLHDLEHLKLLYNSMLRDRKLPGPVWRRQNVHYREIPGKLCSLASKIQQLKQRVAAGETGNVDYYALIGLRRGCSRSELERAHLLLVLKHKPDKSSSFIDRCEFADDKEMDSVRDRAKLSALLLYKLIQKGYNNLMAMTSDEEAVEKQRQKANAALKDTIQVHQKIQDQRVVDSVPITISKAESGNSKNGKIEKKPLVSTALPAAVYQGVFCRDLAVVGNLLSQAGYNRPILIKYEALSC